jgi:hypothetical protein
MDAPDPPLSDPRAASAPSGAKAMVGHLPIVPHFEPRATPDELAHVESLAAQLLREQPSLVVEEQFRPLVIERWEDAPALHLDDLSGMTRPSWAKEVHFIQDRARLRAGDGDFVAASHPLAPGYEEYCRDYLGLGSPHWLHPQAVGDRQIAYSCWQDREVRRALVRALREERFLHVHPYLGGYAVWQLAALLHRRSRRSVKVVAPPPAVTKWVNDKLSFTETVVRLFGSEFVPVTDEAANLVGLAQKTSDLAQRYQCLAIKVPDSAGGGGNVMIEAVRLRGRSLSWIRRFLKHLLARSGWNGQSKLLIGCWEVNVLSAPSAQLWIPSVAEGPPVVEGLFQQAIDPATGYFLGSQPADFPQPLSEELVNRCWRLGLLYQRLGYVSRCSFDMLLVGESLDRSRLKFIECNGRWGGTSLPMTLMNRLVGDWATQPFAAQECRAEGLDKLQFSDVLEGLRDDLFNVRTRQGSLVLYNPGRMQAHSAINVLALANSWEEAHRLVEQEVPARLAALPGSGRG